MNNFKKTVAFIMSVIMLISIHTFVAPVFAEELDNLDNQPMNEEYVEQEEVEPEILSEIVDKRDEYTKHFYLSDGTFLAAEYSSPIHFETENGDWFEYDNTLEQHGDEETGVYTTVQSNHPTSLAIKAASDRIASIDDSVYPISWGYEGAKSSKLRINDKNVNKKGNERFITLEKISTMAEYKNLFPHVDLQYIIDSKGVKENLILKNKNASSEYVMNYQIGELVPHQADEKKIELQNEQGKTVYVITAPTMYDQNGQYSDMLMLNVLSNENGMLSVQLLADSIWLADKEREYPVIVDPTITTKTTQSAIDSVFIASSNSYKNSNFNDRQEMLVGRETSAYEYCRSLFHFTLPQLNKGDMVVDATMSVLNAELTFYASTTPDMQVNAHLISESWNLNTVTWNNSPSFDSTILDYDMFERSNWPCWQQFNISTAVKEWYESGNNFGILLKSNDESSSAAINGVKAKLWTERYNSATDYYPVIAITYRNNKGLEDYWTYTSLSAGTAGTAYINDYTGNLVFVHNDLATTGELMPVSLDHVYNGYMANSNASTYPHSGRGNKLSLQQTVKSSSYYGLSGNPLTYYPYAYEDGDGTVHFFYKDTSGSTTKYIDEDGLGLELKILSGNAGYTITDKSDNKLTFNSDGNLSSIADADGNAATLTYTQKLNGSNVYKPFLTKVTDGAGHSITIASNTGDNGCQITSITGPDNKTVQYTTSGGLVTRITYADGTYSSYSYDSSGLLLTACSADNYKLTFTYTGGNDKRVKTVTESYGSTAGQKIVFDRSKLNQTTIETYGKDSIDSNNNIITTYQFDNYGRTISTKSKLKNGTLLGAEKYDYTEGQSSDVTGIKQRNRVLTSAGFGKNANNLIKNSSAENSNDWTKLYWIRTITDTSIANAALVSSDSYLGEKSARVRVSECAQAGGYSMYQTTTSILTPGQTYTFSAYVKTSNIVETIANDPGGACLAMRFTLSDGSYSRVYSNHITGTTDTSIDNGWQRISKTFTVPSNATASRAVLLVHNATGAANFDCIQIESGNTAESYNLLSNSSFETSNDWSSSSTLTTSDVPSTAYHVNGSKSQKITGNTAQNKYVYQTVKVSGTEADTYVLSGWARADSVPLTDNSRKFDLSVNITYSDNTTKKYRPAEFNPNVNYWQYSSGIFTLSDGNSSTNKTPVSITVYCNFHGQANVAYFDDIRLTKEPCPTYTYDNEGNLVSAKENASSQASLNYDAHNNLSSFTDERNANYTYSYNTGTNKHQLKTAESSSSGVKYNYSYNTNGTLKAQEITNASEAATIRTGIQYTSASGGIAAGAYVLSENDQHGHSTTYDYNLTTGRLNSVTDPMGNTTSYSYNANNGLMQSVSNGTQTVSYTYNTQNTRLSSIGRNGMTYGFTYDGFGNVINTKVGTTTLVTNTYQPNNGNLITSTYGNNSETEYEYNSFGQQTKVIKDDVTTAYWRYNSAGTPYLLEDYTNNLERKYDYDSLGRLITQYGSNRSTGVTRFVGQYGYDLSNNVTKVSNYADGNSLSVSYNYNTENLPTQLTMGSSAYKYYYDSLNRPIQTSLQTGGTSVFNVTYSYRSSDRNGPNENLYTTTQIEYETIGDTSYWYKYNNNGNITHIYEKKAPSTSYVLKLSYGYDSLGQVTRVNDAHIGKTILYTYDQGGNLTKQREYAYSTAGTLGAMVNQINYTYGDTNWKDKLTNYNGQTISYDAIGNPTTYRDNMGFTWQGRQMCSATLNGTSVTYKYNADGLRSYKKVGSNTAIEYEYLGDKLVYENRGYYKFYYAYDAAGNLAEIKWLAGSGTNNTFTFFAVCNSRGDVVELRRADGTLYARYEYDAWGNPRVYDANGNLNTNPSSMAFQNPIRYRGYYYDSESGLYYLQSRYYDPITCRFISADGQLSGIGEDLLGYNLYAYCTNDPINSSDNEGLWPKWAKKLVIAAAIVAAVAVVAAVTVATAGAGTVGAVIAVGAAKGAAIGLVAGAVTGAATGAGMHRLSTGSWKGAKQAALNGMGNGALSGAISGAVMGGIKGAVSFHTQTSAPISGSACFVAGTSVLSETGLVAIETIKRGDMVWAEDPETGARSLKRVSQTFINKTDELIHIFLANEEIVTTPEHPFYLAKQGWTGAANLKVGDHLVLVNGQCAVVDRIQHELLEKPSKVYNLEVTEYHTYFVGLSSVLVHNTCKATNPSVLRNTPDQDAVIQLAKENRRGLSMENAKTLVEWAKEYNLKGNPRIDLGHLGRVGVSAGPHAHIGPINHIKIF